MTFNKAPLASEGARTFFGAFVLLLTKARNRNVARMSLKAPPFQLGSKISEEYSGFRVMRVNSRYPLRFSYLAELEAL